MVLMKLDDYSDKFGIKEGFAKGVSADGLCFSSKKEASAYYSYLRGSYMKYDMDRYNR